MLVIVLVIFFMMQVIPGNPISVMMGEKASPAVIERVTEEMGLNDPMIVRFTNYVRDALHGDFGRSYKLNREVSDLIWEAFPNTVILAVTASLVAWIIGIPAGIVSAVKKDSLLDRGLMGFSLTGISLPVFWVAMLVQWVFGYQLGWFPISGYTTPLHKVLPALVLGWSSAGSIARMTRSNLLETLRNDFVRTARAKGLSGKGVIWKHALKNAMMPVVTMMAIQFASMLSGRDSY